MDIEIHTPYITLGQLLKVADIVRSGGEVKSFLERQSAIVNGEQEQRRGRKLYPGDTVVVQGTLYTVKAMTDSCTSSH
ncbi:S4 domain protein YaaA [Alicyclobacillus contaminans]|uniref:S4 domain-containing protein YaaA n=1 Tax=Alicyclobacillus contaminans TaxID=392016 RepID=UPI00041F7CC9|nr:S4 domain-containing protein YaaA [Alicyclobacillus contaminans]GMA50739.1 S4 domain protein YaaA [Alicyclobacillus contaminans]